MSQYDDPQYECVLSDGLTGFLLLYRLLCACVIYASLCHHVCVCESAVFKSTSLAFNVHNNDETEKLIEEKITLRSIRLELANSFLR